MPIGVYKRKPFTDKHKKNIGKSNSISMIGNQNVKGKHWRLSDKAKQNISKGEIKRYKDLKVREMASNGQKKRFENPKEREKSSNAALKRYEDPREREKRSGKNCNFYIDGCCSEDDRNRTSRPEHRYWAKQIRKRDNYICQLCRKRGWIAHHIDYDPDNFDLDNGVCLCRSCHGKTNVDRDKWIKFFHERLVLLEVI